MTKSVNKIAYTYLFGDTSNENIKEVVKDIDKANQNKEIDEIVLVMNSWGGYFYASFGLFDHIRFSKKPIDIIAEGTCQSCAVMILQAGRKRFSMPNTVFMIHPSSNKIEDSLSFKNFIAESEQYKVDHDLFVELTISRCGMGKKEFEALYEPQRFLTPEQALKLGKNGLIDEILSVN
jgi:ATP-dependent protease ClpP protease subunit